MTEPFVPGTAVGSPAAGGLWMDSAPPPVNATPATAVQLPTEQSVETDTSGQLDAPVNAPTDVVAPAWYSVSSPTEEAVQIDATESDFAAAVAVYSGESNDAVAGYGLTLVVKGNGKVQYKPTPNVTYSVAVGGDPLAATKTGTQKVKKTVSRLLGVWGVPLR